MPDIFTTSPSGVSVVSGASPQVAYFASASTSGEGDNGTSVNHA